MGYAIINQDKGVFMGIYNGFCYFSNIDTAGVTEVSLIKDKEVADNICDGLSKTIPEFNLTLIELDDIDVITKEYCKSNDLVWV